MLRYRDLPRHTTDVLDLTSLTVDEFAALVRPFDEAFLQYMAAWTFHGRPRQSRRHTTYKNCPLPTAEDRLLFVLVYLKQNPLQTLHGHLFGMRQSKTNRWLHVLLPVLRTTLRALGDAPCRSIEALRQRLGVEVPALSLATAAAAATSPTAPLFCHDGTERPIPRPTDPVAQKTCYSGKKKRHMLKNLLLINATVGILFLSETHQGSVHDKRIADTTPYPLPAGSHLLQDTGFQAFTLEGVAILQPTKKPRGQELTPAQKADNQAVSRRRVRIEHVNSSVKRCRMLQETIRLWKEGIRDMVMEIGCALHNFRVRFTPSWTPIV